MTDPSRHSPIEDAQGLVFGTLMAAFAMLLLTSLGLITGQTAGLAVLISYATGWKFGWVFFVINIPFYWLGWVRIGKVFVLKTFLAVALFSAMTLLLPRYVAFGPVQPGVGAVLFGAIAGTGLLALFRHGASLGGIGILALMLQDRTGFRAGYAQLVFDAALFVIAFAVVPWMIVLWSFLGALTLNLVIAVNHRRDRYIAT